tara:strand:+ start:11134 stop:12447 length:1314 start_codon:yes stop_codon:yes gene_type:complete
MKKISCRYLQRAVYYAPTELRHCCKRYFHEGKLMGDVKIFDAKKNEDISLNKVIEAKKVLIEKINKGEKTDCYGCPVLEESEWKNVEDEKFDHISIEHHAKCNMRCTYCNDTYYGGNLAKYDVQKGLTELVEKNKLRDDLQVAWGGGEPTITKDFKKLIGFVNNSMKPKTQRFFSNAINFSEEIADLLKKNKASITTSVDAGSAETFKKVRKVNQYDKVLKNLKKYYDCSPNNLVIKYILTDENSSFDEVEKFVKDMKKYGLSKSNFLISSNYWNEKLTFEQGMLIIYFQYLLSDRGAATSVLDEHVRPRISKIAKEILNDNKIIEKLPQNVKKVIERVKAKKDNAKEIIVWGIGEYAHLLLDNSVTFSDSKVKFFVDSSPYKQGKTFRNSKVLKPENITSSNLPILIASSFWYHEILTQIKTLGVKENRVLSGSFI